MQNISSAFFTHVEFGNVLDITREMGRAIYTASLVYDWCYDLMSQEDKATLRNKLMRLASDMECGWPPFGQSVINGHGNEAQINRDLLAMSIALYRDDSLPYQYTSYIILDELVPMQKFEYQSPRHNQGVSFLTVFQMTAGDTKPLEVEFVETEASFVVSLADRVVSMNKNSELIETPFTIRLLDGGERQVLLTDWHRAIGPCAALMANRISQDSLPQAQTPWSSLLTTRRLSSVAQSVADRSAGQSLSLPPSQSLTAPPVSRSVCRSVCR